MVKKIFLCFAFALFAGLQAQEIATDRLSIPGPLDYDGTEYYLFWSKQVSKTLYRQQYLPADERPEDFTQILDVSFFTKDIDIELAVRQKVESIQNRQEKDKFAKVNVTESPDGKEFIVDYYISEIPSKGEPFVEYNIFRFKPMEQAGQKKFLILSYAKRIYGDLKSAAKGLSKERDRLITSMIEYKVPDIKVAETPGK